MGKYRTFNSSSSNDSSAMDHVETYDLNSNIWSNDSENWYRNDGKYNREKLTELESEITSISDVIIGSTGLTRHAGSINAANGQIESTIAYNFYINVDVRLATIINVPMFKTESTYGLAFYKANGEYISGAYNNSLPSGTRFTYNVPNNASYMLYSYIIDTIAEQNNAPVFDRIIVGLNIDSILQGDPLIKERLFKIDGLTLVERTSLQVNYGTINTNTGAIEGTSYINNIYVKIPLSGAKVFEGRMFKTGSFYGSGFYSSNDTFISGIKNTTEESGTIMRYEIPDSASYMLYSYLSDVYAEQDDAPKFTSVNLYHPSVLSSLDERVTALESQSGQGKRPRPVSGVESFQVKINKTLPNNETGLTLGDTYAETTDYGIIQLPTNYTPHGTPVRLCIVCHGAGTNKNQYRNPVVTDGKVMGDPAKYLVQKGYACMDMYATPDDLVTEQGTDMPNHLGNPRVLLCYKAGYDYVVKNYNVRTDGIFVCGSSMGGLSSFQIVQSGMFPVIAQAAFCPCVDLFKQAYCNPWSHRYFFAQLFGFNKGVAPSAWVSTEPTQEQIDYFVANKDKIIGYNPIARMLVQGDYDETYTTIPASIKAREDATEKALYDTFRAIHPVPLKIWHCEDDQVVCYRYSEYLFDMLKRSGALVQLHSFPSGGHNAWDNGEIFNDFDIDGNAISTKVSQRECFLWFERFN